MVCVYSELCGYLRRKGCLHGGLHALLQGQNIALAVVADVRRAELLGKRVLARERQAVVRHRLVEDRVQKHAAHGHRVDRRRPQDWVAQTDHESGEEKMREEMCS